MIDRPKALISWHDRLNFDFLSLPFNLSIDRNVIMIKFPTQECSP